MGYYHLLEFYLNAYCKVTTRGTAQIASILIQNKEKTLSLHLFTAMLPRIFDAVMEQNREAS